MDERTREIELTRKDSFVDFDEMERLLARIRELEEDELANARREIARRQCEEAELKAKIRELEGRIHLLVEARQNLCLELDRERARSYRLADEVRTGVKKNIAYVAMRRSIVELEKELEAVLREKGGGDE